jgi:hypothetical protein
VALGRFSPSTSVFPANLHSTSFFTITITYHMGLVQQASSGRSTQSPTAQIKGKKKKQLPDDDLVRPKHIATVKFKCVKYQTCVAL